MTDLVVPAVLPKSWVVKEARGDRVTFAGTDQFGAVLEVTLSSAAPHFEPVVEVLGDNMSVGAGTKAQPLSVTVM